MNEECESTGAECKGRHRLGHDLRRGPTSFHMLDQNIVFREINVKKGDSLLDLGCGMGEYAIRAAGLVGSAGHVYALDIQPGVIENLKENVASRGLNNITAWTADITKSLPVKSGSIDICLLSTVLHALDFKTTGEKLFAEVLRVLKPGGRLVTIDCKKEHAGFGPPVDMRISSAELEEQALKCGFANPKLIDVGHFYMCQFGA